MGFSDWFWTNTSIHGQQAPRQTLGALGLDADSCASLTTLGTSYRWNQAVFVLSCDSI